MGETAELCLLGPVELRQGERLINIGDPRQRSVLAALAIDANRAVTTDTLLERVWGERLPASGRSGLYTYVSRLRTSLATLDGPTGIRLGRASGGYLLEIPSDAVDVHRFRRLAAEAAAAGDELAADGWAEALRLWRGPALDGLSSLWIDLQRETLERERLSAILDRNDVELRRGRHAGLLAELAELAGAHPLDTRLICQLVLAEYRSGRQAAAVRHYHQTRTLLAEELGVDPWPELQELYEQILRNDLVLAPSPGPEPVPPAQLPPTIAGFVDRDAELAELTGLLERPAGHATAVCVIDGPGGVGKTALVVQVGHRLAGRFPDGQLYVDLCGFDLNQAPLPASEALGRFLRALAVDPRRVPTDLGELTALYRSVLAGKRVLVVLDNAAEADQVRPLIPGTPSCGVLITSRNRLDGLGARDGVLRLTLDVLRPREATELVTHVVGHARADACPGAAGEVARLCGYLPLALRVAAERAAARPHLTLTELADDLAVERERLDVLTAGEDHRTAVRTVFSWSYRALDAVAARTFRLLSLHPRPEFSDEAAAALTGVAARAAQPALDGLTGRHLLRESGNRRRQFHDLVRIYAAERAGTEDPEPERDAAVRRMLAWYLHTADAAGAVLVPVRRRAESYPLPPGCQPLTFASRERALAWCERERMNLVSAVYQAAETGNHAIAWRIPLALWDFFYQRSYWSDWVATHRIGLVSARQDGNMIGEAGLLTSLGTAYRELGLLADALQITERARVLWQEIGDPHGLGTTLNDLGDVYQALEQFDDAGGCYRKALGLHHGIDNRWGQGWAQYGLGAVMYRTGRHGAARKHWQQALDIFDALNDPRAAEVRERMRQVQPTPSS